MESGIQIFLMFSLSRRRERNIYLIKPQYNKHGISEKGLIIYFKQEPIYASHLQPTKTQGGVKGLNS